MAGYRKLGRPTDHRKAMLRNMVTSFLEHGKMTTEQGEGPGMPKR